jgi:hypothetical protein
MAALVQPAHAADAEFSAANPSPQARSLVEWVQRSGDSKGKPFAVVDKRGAHLYVFHAGGRLAGHSQALLGSTIGDHIVPGVGQRAQTGQVREDERTTPAGRFEAEPGVNNKGEHVVWVDYDSAFAIHRLRPGFAYQSRATRLVSARAEGKRVTWGCVVVPVAFYTQVVQKVLGTRKSVVYVLPDIQPVQHVFNAL